MDVARTRDGRRVDAGWTRAAEKKWFAGVRREIPFAPNPVSFSAMAKKQTPFAAALRDVPPAYRSDLYNWLRGKYRDLAKLANKPKPNWTEIAAKVAAEGPIGANGQAVVPNNLRRMWLRLDRDMKQEEAERLAKRVTRKTPNRSPRQTAGRHEVVPATPRVLTPVRVPEPAHHPPLAAAQTVASEQGAPASTPPKRLTVEDLPPEAKAQLDKLRKGLTDWDRRRHGI